jgi:hypothetical protein
VKFYFKLITDSELPGLGMIFSAFQMLLKVSDPTGSGSTKLVLWIRKYYFRIQVLVFVIRIQEAN